MAESGVGTGKPKQGSIARLKKPRRLQVVIEYETYKRLRYIAVDRDLAGVSGLVQEALELWLEAQGTKSQGRR